MANLTVKVYICNTLSWIYMLCKSAASVLKGTDNIINGLEYIYQQGLPRTLFLHVSAVPDQTHENGKTL